MLKYYVIIGKEQTIYAGNAYKDNGGHVSVTLSSYFARDNLDGNKWTEFTDQNESMRTTLGTAVYRGLAKEYPTIEIAQKNANKALLIRETSNK